MRESDIHPYVRLILQGLATFIDKGTWRVEVTQTGLGELIGVPTATMSKYWAEATDSKYVEQAGVFRFTTGSREYIKPAYALVVL